MNKSDCVATDFGWLALNSFGKLLYSHCFTTHKIASFF